jgi:hypothetical protein
MKHFFSKIRLGKTDENGSPKPISFQMRECRGGSAEILRFAVIFFADFVVVSAFPKF